MHDPDETGGFFVLSESNKFSAMMKPQTTQVKIIRTYALVWRLLSVNYFSS